MKWGANSMSNNPSNGWAARHARWLEYVVESVKAMERGADIPIGPSSESLNPELRPAAEAPKVIVCSPHPDDEALIGALPLRLRTENGANVVDCAITLGSNAGQKKRRKRELESACRVLGFRLLIPETDSGPLGFDHINQDTRQNHSKEWAAKVEILAEVFAREKPDAVFAPHAEDFNTTHIGTHFLAAEALTAYLKKSGRAPLPFFETEFWHQMFAPNLMVGVAEETVATQLMATAEHGGEVSRNPYHLRFPGRMIDNVRRGSEVVGGQGGPARAFPFAELYNVSFATNEGINRSRAKGLTIAPEEKIDLNFIVKHFFE
jgi:N-acetylglucosamine malate deacetylase 1